MPLKSVVPAGAYRVVIRSKVGVPSLLHVDLHHLIVRGASVREHDVEHARAAIAHALVEGDYHGALALADTEGMSQGSLAERMQLSEAMVVSGRLAEVQTIWRELLALDPPQPQLDAVLTAQLRRSPQLYGSLLASVSPQQQVRRTVAAWRNFAVNHRGRQELRPRFWEAMQTLALDHSADLRDTVDALVWRAYLLADVGEHQAGLRALKRALDIIEASPQGAPVRDQEWVVALAQAKLAIAAGDVALTDVAVARARRAATMPLVVEDRLRADPKLASRALDN